MTRGRAERALIIVLDGLRPDFVDDERMPFLASLQQQGTRLAHYSAAYPPHTRVQVTTMCTGTHPGQHGIVSNILVLPGAGEEGILDTSDYRQLMQLDERTDGRAVLRPPLADFLAVEGRRLAVAASGSTGSTWLWARTQPYRVVNPRSIFGIPDLASLREKLGDPPDPQGPSIELVRYAMAAAGDLFLPDPEVGVTILWLHEPDATFHFAGLGSPESETVLRVLDGLLERFFEHLASRGLLDDLLIFLLSDHGQSTPRRHRSLRELLRDAPASPALHSLVPAADFLFRAPHGPDPRAADLEPLVDWFLQQDWVGAVFAHPALAPHLPGSLDFALLWGGSLGDAAAERVPVLGISPTWSGEPNQFGIPGTVSALTEQVALRSTHGAGSPFDLRAFALALGPGVAAGRLSNLPAGVADIVPTVLAALGLGEQHPFSGRILRELFDPAHNPSVTIETQATGPDRFVRGWRVDGTFYLDQVSGEPLAEQERYSRG